MLGLDAAAQRLAERGRGAGTGGVAAAALGDGAVLPTGLVDPSAVGDERAAGLVDAGALTGDVEGERLLGAGGLLGLGVEGVQLRLELVGAGGGGRRGGDGGGAGPDLGVGGVGGVLPGVLAQRGELPLGEGEGLCVGGLRLLGGAAGGLGGLDLLRADGVLGGVRGVGVLVGAADGAGGFVLEVGGELGGDPGEAAPTQRGLLLSAGAGGAQGALGRLLGLCDGLDLGICGGRGLQHVLRGGEGEPRFGEARGGGAGLLARGDEGTAGSGALLEPDGRSLQLLLPGREGLASGAELLLPLGQRGLEVDEVLEGAGGAGRLVGRGGECGGGVLGLLREEVDEVGVRGSRLLGARGEGLDRGRGGLGGGVASPQHLDDGAGGLVALERGRRLRDLGLLRLEAGRELVELSAAIDSGAGGAGGLGGRPRGLLHLLRRGGGSGGLGRAGGDLRELGVGRGGEGLEAQCGGVLGERGGVLVLEGDGLGEARQRCAEGLLSGVDLALRLFAHLLELLLDGGVGLGAEDALQHLLALPGAGAEEAGELVLGQQDGLGELLAGEADGALHLAAHLVDAAGDHLAAVAGAGGVGDRGGQGLWGPDPPHQGLGLLLRGAGAAQLGALELRGAAHAVQSGGGLEDEVDDARLRRRGELGADPVGAGGGAGDLPVEGVDDRVEDRGLAGARRPLEQEGAGGAEGGEVDLDGAGEGADPGHAEVVELHDASCWRRTAE